VRAFVTGGTGFVGSHLVERLLEGGADVRALVRSDPKWLAGLPVEVVRGDLGDAEALAAALQGVDQVYHVAGLTRAPDPAALHRANVEGTLRLLEAAEAAGVERVLVTSSLAAVGPSGPEPHTEDAPHRPVSAYGRSKAAMEQRLAERVAEREGGPAVTVVRPPAVYGPREADIYTVIKTADRQRLFPIVGDPHAPALDLVHVRDLVAGMVKLMATETTAGETYFLGGRPHSWAEIRDGVLDALGHGALTVRVPKALVGPVGAAVEGVGRLLGRYPPLNREKAREAKEAWLVSSEKAARDVGYAPEVELAEGLRETVAWYRAHGWL